MAAERLARGHPRRRTGWRASTRRNSLESRVVQLAAATGALSFLGETDDGTRSRALLSLQRSIGNRAVAQAVSRARTSPVASAPASSASLHSINSAAAAHAGLAVIGTPAATGLPPRSGIMKIKSEEGGAEAAGYTRLPATPPIELELGQPRKTDKAWVAPPAKVTVQQEAPYALYPAAGVHDLPSSEEGPKRHGYVAKEVSEVIRKGEEEHLSDIEWARHLTYDTIAGVINAVAESPPVAETPEAALGLSQQAVCSALPAQLRWPAGSKADAHWRTRYAQLVGVTRGRDKSGWHFVPAETIRLPYEEAELKSSLGVPKEDELKRYTNRSEIGAHLSEVIVPAAFKKL